MLVGITGGIASGKSTLLGIFREEGFGTFDADAVVQRLYNNPKIIRLIGLEFGGGIISQGKVDRKMLARLVFADHEKLARLNSIVHPLVRKKIRGISNSGKIVFVEVPLLFEAKFDNLFTKIILVKSSSETALKRALAKGLSPEDFGERSAFMLPFAAKEKLADFVVDSNCPVSALKARAQAISKELLAISPKVG